jgi:hypothetical protein
MKTISAKMPNTRLAVAKIVLLLAALFWGRLATAQSFRASTGASVEDIVQARMAQEGYVLAGTWQADLRQGEVASRWHTFTAGYEYVVVAFPTEPGVNDVDVELYDETSRLTKDEDTGVGAALRYTIYRTRPVKVVMKNYESNSTYYAYRCKYQIYLK